MLGGLGRLDAETYGADLTLRMAQTLGAKMRLLSAPGVVSSQLVHDALMQDPNIAETLALAANADIALVGIGTPVPGAIVRQVGVLTDPLVEELQRAEVVGDIALRFFDANGHPTQHPINDRMIGLTLEQIKNIPRVIGVAGGPHKFEVIQGAIRGRSIDVLITDEHVALRLLADAISQSPHDDGKVVSAN